MVRLCLVRHGETAWNIERRIQGQIDIPLNAHGEVQAQATAGALAPVRFDAMYSSDLSRAHATANAVAERQGQTLFSEPALRERNYGAFQGLTYAEAEVRFPDDYPRFIARDPAYAFPDGGESLIVFSQRVRAELERIADRHTDGCVLIVTHGGVLDIIHRLVTGKPLDTPRDFTIPNAALNWICRDDTGWSLLSWGEHAHLPGTNDELPA